MSTKHDPSDDDTFVRLPTVLRMTGKSQAAVYRDMRDGKFPRHVVLGPNARAWRLAEIKAWMAERITARDTGADANLRAVNPNIGRGRQRHQAQQAA